MTETNRLGQFPSFQSDAFRQTAGLPPAPRSMPLRQRRQILGRLVRVDHHRILNDLNMAMMLVRRRAAAARELGLTEHQARKSAVAWLRRLEQKPSEEYLFRLVDTQSRTLGHIGAGFAEGRVWLSNLSVATESLPDTIIIQAIQRINEWAFSSHHVDRICVRCRRNDLGNRILYRSGFSDAKSLWAKLFERTPNGQQLVTLQIRRKQFVAMQGVTDQGSPAHA